MPVGVKSVRALARGLDVFKMLHQRRVASLQELHSDTRLAKPTLLRILKTLEEGGLARRSLDGRYRVSAGVRLFAQSLGEHDAIAEQAAPVLDRLCRAALWPSDLTVYKQGAMEIIESSRPQTPFLVNRDRIGFRVHMLMSAMGRAYLAYCPAAERDKILARLRQSDDPYDRAARQTAAVRSSLIRDRTRGYSVREAGYGTWISGRGQGDAIAVPVLQDGRVVACLSLSWMVGAASQDEMVARHLERLQAAAADIAAYVKIPQD